MFCGICVIKFLRLTAIFVGASTQWCVLLPVVLTLVANQDRDDKFGRVLRNYCYPTWALEAFLISNAQR